jgi:hypothetical protein
MRYSTPLELQAIGNFWASYGRLPFSRAEIPGGILEWLIAQVHSGEVPPTYDFIDVVDRGSRVGWQIKSTKADTPITWKRVKIPNQSNLIKGSQRSPQGRQILGDTLIDFCNAHARESFVRYPIDFIGYARLVIHADGGITYFERQLCTREEPMIFRKEDFIWRWSEPKRTTKKEQLSALHGIHRDTGVKWFAWHGRGENQFHFTHEKAWWPTDGDTHAITISSAMGADKMTLGEFLETVKRTSGPS